MKILFVNGSPRGRFSVTLQSCLYLEKRYPRHSFEYLNVGSGIQSFERDMAPAAAAFARAELVIFAYPVYSFLVPSQLHRFLELMRENELAVKNQYATQLSTSKHFFDVTAHRFVEDNLRDLGMRVIRGLSADMEDLLEEKGRKEALAFFRHVLWSMEQGIAEPEPPTLPAAELHEASPLSEDGPKGAGRIAVVTDLAPDNPRLAGMIARFTAAADRPCTVVNLRDFPFAGGCVGCFHCAADGTCIYRDGFDRLLRENIQGADATVYAFTIRDHSMGYRFKLYDDRQFCNGHRTVTMGRPVGYLIDGQLSAEPNLRELIEARAQVGGNQLARIAGNEGDVDREIDALARELGYAIDHDFQQPANFYGVGGMKIFRDLIFTMQGLMREDHRFYKQHGFYDFPQKRAGRILGMYAVGAMMHSKKLSKKLGGNMTKGMLMPYQAVIDKAKRGRKRR